MVRIVAQLGHCSYKAAPGPEILEDCGGENSPKRIPGLALARMLWEVQGYHVAVKKDTASLAKAA